MLLPSAAYACQPMATLFILTQGPKFLSSTFLGLILAIVVKTVAFTLLEKKMPLAERPLPMLGGNLVSSIVGIAAGLPFAVPQPEFILASVIVLAVIGRGPMRRLMESWGFRGYLWPLLLVVYVVLVFLGGAAFMVGMFSLEADQYLQYWMLKFAMVAVGFPIGFTVSTLCEEWTIAWFKARSPSDYYYRSVVQANLITFLVVAGLGAAMMLPKRLASPHFLAEAFQQALAVLSQS